MREEITGALKKVKGDKAAGVDGIIMKMLKKRSISITNWLLRIFNSCMDTGTRGLVGSVYRPCIPRER